MLHAVLKTTHLHNFVFTPFSVFYKIHFTEIHISILVKQTNKTNKNVFIQMLTLWQHTLPVRLRVYLLLPFHL